jgi:hypothetical protein
MVLVHRKPGAAALALFAFFISGICSAQTATSTALSASPTPSLLGEPVNLTATVTPSAATGKVTFYDGTTILGVATITGGTASLTTVMLPSGARSLRAYYAGDSGHSASTSMVVTQNVTAAASLGFRPPVSYSAVALASDIAVADLNGDLKLDLVVSATNATAVLLGNGDGTFQSALNVTGGGGAIATGDFDGDGRIDLALANSGSWRIVTLLGNGNGTFQPPSESNALYQLVVSVADLNRDGRADLLSADYGGFVVRLGNGNGTFQASVNYPNSLSIGGPRRFATGDLNGDGIVDLAFSSHATQIGTRLGIGDGSFAAAQTLNSVGLMNPISIGDLNGDGKADLVAVQADYSGLIRSWLGNGDGTFQSAFVGSSSGPPSGLHIADFNGDGYLDVVVFPSSRLHRGLGDGNFAAGVPILPSDSPGALVSGDFNGDFRTDVAFVSGSSVRVALGGAVPDLALTMTSGNGLTQGEAGASYLLSIRNIGEVATAGSVGVTATMPAGLTASAISGTGWTCLLGTLTCTRTDSINPQSSFPDIQITVNVSQGLTGNVTATGTVSVSGDTNLANNVASNTTFVRFAVSTALTSTPNPSLAGQAVTLTATVTAGTGTVAFEDGDAVLGYAALVGNQATLFTTLAGSGARSLTARYLGDSTNGPSRSPARIHTVNAVAADGMQPKVVLEPGAAIIAGGDFNRDGKADVVLSSGVAFLGNGNGTFQKISGSFSGPGTVPNDMVAGDFNVDGKLDLVIMTWSSLQFFAGRGDGTFQAPVSTAGGGRSLSVADLDQDGFPDLVGSFEDFLRFRLGKGDGSFGTARDFLSSTVPGADFRIADMNGDRRPDLIYVVNVSGNADLRIALNTGNGNFQPGASVATSFFPYAMAVADFNGDGVPDVLAASFSSVDLFRGNANGTLQPAIRTTVVNLSVAGKSITGDFNGDGKMDCAMSRYSSSSGLWFILGNGDGTFRTQAALFPTDGNFPSGFAADFNSDGRLDVAVGHPSSSLGVNLLFGAQAGGLTVTVSHHGKLTEGQSKWYEIEVANWLFQQAAGDVSVSNAVPIGMIVTAISGSGWTCTLATATCSRSDTLDTGSAFPIISMSVLAAGTLSPGTLTTSATVTWNGTSRTGSDQTLIVSYVGITLQATPVTTALSQPVTLTATLGGGTGLVSFFDEDILLGAAPVVGNQATISTALIPAGRRRIFAIYGGDSTRGASRSNTVTVTVNANPSSGLVAAASPATGAGPTNIATGDLNGDGKPDLVTVNRTARTVSILAGNGNGTFQPKVDYSIDFEPSNLVLGDFSSDGKLDILVAGNSTAFSVLINNGGGTFAPGIATTEYVGASTLPVADFDRDGDLDIARFSYGSSSVLMGNGNGTFQSRTTPSLCCYLVYRTGDMNNDGKMDLVTHLTFLGAGDGTFQSTGVSNNLEPLLLGDFDRDGNLDIAGGYYSFVAKRGKGDGSFYPANTTNFDQYIAAMAAGDLNGDTHLDVLAVGNSAHVFLGAGNGTFSSAISYATGTQPSSAVIADFNGDGRSDVATANAGSNNITVLLGVLTPVLSVNKTHTGSFFAGQTGAVYTISVANQGPGVTSGTITMVDQLPIGMTATAISGTGWTCVLGTLTCTRSDTLAAAASYPPITVTVNVSAGAPAQLINQVTVSGGGSPTASALDPTAILAAANPPTLLYPPDAATKVSTTPAFGWAPVEWATAYDVYFGTTNPPTTQIASTTNTHYVVPSPVANGTAFFWRIVARNGVHTASSVTRSFTTNAGGTVPVSVAPGAGTAGRQAFTFRTRHLTSANSIQYAQFLFAKGAVSALNACYISYDPAVNVFYLLSDDMTQWYGLLGNSPNSIGNSQCTLHGAASASSKSGTDLTTVIDVSFRSGFSGAKNIYQFAADAASGGSGWQQIGTWNDTGDPKVVELISITPNSGTGISQTFSAVVRDGDGAATIAFAQLVINGTLSGTNGCFIHYDRASNTFFLLNNTGTAWSGLPGGSAGQVSNSQCTLRGTGSGGTSVGSNLTITFNLEFAPAFSGLKKFYMQAVDNTNVIQVWRQMATWTR